MPVLTPPVRAVLLDMDGTLVNSDAVVERCWRRWAARHGLDADEVMRVAHGRQGHLTMGLLLPDRPAEQNLAENALMLDEESADTDGVVEVPGAARLMASLAGLPHALVTSADDRLARIRMAAAGVPLPPLLITAEQVGASKPDPEGFLKAAAELGVAPAECLVLEDSEAGIAAGRAAGMPVLGVGPRAAAHRPDHHVTDLTGVRIGLGADGALVVELP
ncbi:MULTISPECIES: HAD-IA family hydrolase [Kitasatospora]|uniref:Putative phosphatase n=1 Tax=Kitasatospora setae (strain ATCC 33774 / DSM 43861 / JCM 3304 / KCC A-0304 / NBRC 14216 / KM-6054) TaxID=452652 RepID=E4NGF2_KITSK|nr:MULTISPECIES: HAD-IA family hydrolase [Kitasatospora]BAJ30582.1 putative phosphatase [Kitasatospora setae KM-6054]